MVELEVTSGLFQGALVGLSGTDLEEKVNIADRVPYPIAFLALTQYQ